MSIHTPASPSEMYLSSLCRKAFLHLWSYPNLYRDQGKPGQGDGKELCDLLVIFADQVIIFSDKHCAFRESSDVATAWRRWYRSAVLDSAKQISGAERWLLSYPHRVFTDPRCTTPLPIRFPQKPTIHRIVTCRGAAGAARTVWGGSGSLFVTNERLHACSGTPFHLGAFDEHKRMVHVFDEVALDLVLSTVDTAADFCTYLSKKEAFFQRQSFVLAASEEDLLAAYLQRTTGTPPVHDFVVPDGTAMAVFDDSFWKWWQSSKQRAGKQAADRVSYCWDRLIEKFSHHMLNGTQHFATDGGVREGEMLVRWMARENRFSRRMLAEALLGAMRTTQPGQIRRRYIPPQRSGDPYWVYVVLPRPDGLDYEQYRNERRELLKWHCFVVKYLHPDADDIVGIAVEPRPEEITEDAMYLDARSWTPELNEQARAIHERYGIFRRPTRLHERYWEFPLERGGSLRK